ncbi:PAS domain-containing protein [Pedobacter sp. PAMC26386]|nr:PAS domain-containing protein [Pedobacter sp. PAMC26386]
MLTDALFHALFDIPLPRILLSANGPNFKIICDNDAFKDFSNSSVSSGKSVWEVFNSGNVGDESLTLFKNILIQSVENKQKSFIADFKYQASAVEKPESYWKLEIMPVKSNDDKFQYILVTIIGQSDKKKEDTRQYPELSSIISHLPIGLCILSGKEMILEVVNNGMLNLWDRNDSILGLPLLEFMPEITDQIFPKLLQQVYASGIPFSNKGAAVELMVGGRLQTVYMDFSYTPLQDEKGVTNRILVMADDVTDRILGMRREQQLTEELKSINEILAASNLELTENESRFRFLLNALPQQVWTANSAGLLDYVNQVVCNDFGLDVEVVIGHGWQEFVHPDDLEEALARWTIALETGCEYLTEFRLQLSDGKYKWFLARAVPLIENDKILLWIGTNTNIDLQKSNEQRKDEFISIASHELKTPLTSIKAFNQLIQRKNSEHTLDGFILKSAQNITRLERLIKDLLDVTKINAGQITYEMESFDFKKMLAESIESVQLTAPEHDIILESAVDVIYLGDQYRLEQVVHNILTNAVKYSPNGKRIIVKSVIEQERVIVSFQDFGIGIAEKDRKRLFERYYRVEENIMQFEGLGLGLFISSEILKRHKGNFWIESEPGKGSTFYFRLPLYN